jgi:hypothetical protein
MPKNKVSEYSSTASNNTDIGGINIAEGCAPSGINNAIRELMAQLKDMQSGTDGDGFTVGGAFTCSGAAVFSSTVTAPTPTTGDNSTKVATTAFVQGAGIPSGGIIIWSGSSGAIPSGWYLCNGANGTPDLRNRFIVGAGSTYAVGATGGSADSIVVAHTHTGTTNSSGTHDHTSDTTVPRVQIGTDNGTAWAGAASGTYGTSTTTTPVAEAGAHTHTFTTASSGSSGTNANLPPYYALCYIMKA